MDHERAVITRPELALTFPGVTADFFTVAVRTGGKGFGGVSLLLIERGMEVCRPVARVV